MAGAGFRTVSVTGKLMGLFPAPAELTTMLVEWTPAPSPPGLTRTDRPRGVRPLDGVTISHGADGVTVIVQFSAVAVTLLLIVTDWAAG
jgi:hypothetical protein